MLGGVDPLLLSCSDSFSFPFVDLGRGLDLLLGETGESGARGNVEGRKTEAHLSYSRQSKNDLASRYFDNSCASKRASSGSVLVEEKTEVCGSGSASCICESTSVVKDEELEAGVGIALASSAALDCVRDYNT